MQYSIARVKPMIAVKQTTLYLGCFSLEVGRMNDRENRRCCLPGSMWYVPVPTKSKSFWDLGGRVAWLFFVVLVVLFDQS